MPVIKLDNNVDETKKFVNSFNEMWNDEIQLKNITDEVTNFITDLYKENSPEFIYYFTLYNIFAEFLQDAMLEDTLPNELTGYQDSLIWHKLYHI